MEPGTRIAPTADKFMMDPTGTTITSQNSSLGTQSNHVQAGGTDNTQYNAHNLTQNFNHVEAITTEQAKRKACHDALLAGLTRPEVDREALIYAKGKKVEGTCEWIENNAEYQSWLRGDTQLLWICGGPGKGKTIISIFLTQQLEREHHTVYFFCQADNDKRKTASFVLRSLLWQLVAKQPELADHLLQDFGTSEKAQVTLLSRETLWAAFTKIVCDMRRSGAIYLVLDGLDECEEDAQQWLAVKLVELSNLPTKHTRETSMRVIIVSRDTIVSLRKCRQVRLDSDNNDHVSADITAFVSTKTRELFDLHEFSTSAQTAVNATISERAEGTFLWIDFAMAELFQCKTPTEVMSTMRELPKGLPGLYDRMLSGIAPNHRQVSSRLLRWVALAVRPLSLEELGAAAEVSPLAGFDVKQAVEDQLTLCGELVRVADGRATLVHESARDFLLHPVAADSPSLEMFRISPCQAHLELARACVAQSTRMNQKGRQSMPLLCYSLLSWPEHARSSLDLGMQLIDEFPSFFAPNSSLRDIWWQEYVQSEASQRDLIFLESNRKWGHLTALHIASYIGIVPWVRKLLHIESGWKIGRLLPFRRDHGPTPLFMAVKGGRVGAAKLLLELKADVNCQVRQSTALFQAVKYRDEPMVRLLLHCKADVNTKCFDDCTALHVAAEWGDYEVVRMLLACGAEVDATDVFARTPLYQATINEHEAVAQLLAEHGTPIHSAVRSESTSTVQSLIHSGADVNARDRRGRTPLSIAIEKSNFTMMQVLIKAGADLEEQNPEKQTFLHEAVEEQSYEVAKFLIESGANIDASNASGKTPLHLAIDEQIYQSDDRLIESEAIILPIDEEDPAHWVTTGVSRCRLEALSIIQLLLRHGSDLGATTTHKYTPLHIGILEDSPHFDSVRPLIEHRAETSSRNICGNIVMHRPVSAQDESSADETLQDVLLSSRLLSSENLLAGSIRLANNIRCPTSNQEPSLVQLLLESGANTTSRDFDGLTPLQLAEHSLAWSIKFARPDTRLKVVVAASDVPCPSIITYRRVRPWQTEERTSGHQESERHFEVSLESTEDTVS